MKKNKKVISSLFTKFILRKYVKTHYQLLMRSVQKKLKYLLERVIKKRLKMWEEKSEDLELLKTTIT